MAREIKSPPAVILTAKSFDGKHEIQFNEGSHRYKLDGKQAVGVTTFTKGGYVTSMGLISWYKSQTAEAVFKALTVPGSDGYYPRESFWPVTDGVKKDVIKAAKEADRAVSQEAADVGTLCHGYAELHSLGKIDEAEHLLEQVRSAEAWPLIENCVSKYKEWAATNKGELVMAEALVGSPAHLFCGKFDRLDRVNGKLRLRDYKTSKDIFLEQFIQLGGYRTAIREWFNLNVDELEVLRFGKNDGTFDTMVIDNLNEVQTFEEQAIRCRKTYEFRKLEADLRWAWGGKRNAE